MISFCKSVYDPGIHFYFSLNWYLAFFSILCLNHEKTISLKLTMVIPVITLFLVLLYLRIVDEIKDFEYDKTFNPDRPLVKGIVTEKELKWYLLGICSIYFLLNLNYGQFVFWILLLDSTFSYFLISLESISKTVKNNILLNLLITYPVNVLLSFYLLFFELYIWKEDLSPKDLLLILCFALAFLNYEFCRKIKSPLNLKQGERTYSSYFGTIPSKVISDLLALSAITILMILSHSWLPLLAIIPLFWGWSLLSKNKSITLSGTAFIGLFYGICISLGILSRLNLSFHLLVRP